MARDASLDGIEKPHGLRRQSRESSRAVPARGGETSGRFVGRLVSAEHPPPQHPGDTIMRGAVILEQDRPRAEGGMRGMLTALCSAWAAYTVKRAMSDVLATSDRDYREYGLDKAELLAALGRLRDEIADRGGNAAAHADAGSGRPVLAIAVTRRRPQLPGRTETPAPSISSPWRKSATA